MRGPSALTPLLALTDNPDKSPVEYVIGGKTLNATDREDAARLLADDAMNVACGKSPVPDRWRARRDGGPAETGSRLAAVKSYVRIGFGLPDKPPRSEPGRARRRPTWAVDRRAGHRGQEHSGEDDRPQVRTPASTGKYSLIVVHDKRGRVAMDAAGILPPFTGIAVHDAWAPYDCYPAAAHAFSGGDGGGNDNCVEVAFTGPMAALRDSKNAAGPVLRLPTAALDALLTARR